MSSVWSQSIIPLMVSHSHHKQKVEKHPAYERNVCDLELEDLRRQVQCSNLILFVRVGEN